MTIATLDGHEGTCSPRPCVRAQNAKISIQIGGGRTLVVLADDDLGGDRTWSDRILEGLQDCLKGA